MRILLVLFAVFAVASAVSFVDIVKEEWHTFKLSYSRQYKSRNEEKFRQKIYMQNKHTINKHNQKYANGLVSFKLGVNKYADMLSNEFNSLMNGYGRSFTENNSNGLNQVRKYSGTTFSSPAKVDLPQLVDWTVSGLVSSMKDQGLCASGWAFGATGAIESQLALANRPLVPLSEQNLIDCSSPYGNFGCFGGSIDNAFEYIMANDGIDTEISYPYEPLFPFNRCRFDKNTVGATVKGIVNIPPGDEVNMMKAIATTGPVATTIDASHISFQFYETGVYVEALCSQTQLNHGVLVVGYGTDANGTDYWNVKNSWCTSWGVNSYIMMARNNQNQCGIVTGASYPVV